MKTQNVNIATARIKGLNEKPYYSSSFCHYVWDITFYDVSTPFLHNLAFIKAGNTEKVAKNFYNKIKGIFDKAFIFEGDKVPIICKDNGEIIAIGSMGKDIWIDVNDKFVKKTFKELNIEVATLKVNIMF